jgi:hypothetical protein
MTMRQLLLAALLTMGTVGCVGGISGGDDTDPGDDSGDDGSSGTAARTLYERDVYPIMTTNCGAGCHMGAGSTSTPFVGATQAVAYDTVVGYNSVVGNFTTAGAPIWTKIMNPVVHNARTYTADQQAKISAWLAQEVVERSGGVDPTNPTDPTENPGQASERLITQWMSCLKESDFVELQFGEAWANQGSNQGACEVCHSTGYKGMYANDDNVMTYQVLTTYREYMLFFFQPNVLVQDLSTAKMEPNLEHFIDLGLRLPPHQEHPSFDPETANNGIGLAPNEVVRQITTRTQGYVDLAGYGNLCPPVTTP